MFWAAPPNPATQMVRLMLAPSAGDINEQGAVRRCHQSNRKVMQTLCAGESLKCWLFKVQVQVLFRLFKCSRCKQLFQSPRHPSSCPGVLGRLSGGDIFILLSLSVLRHLLRLAQERQKFLRQSVLVPFLLSC